ncbi:hypothetical protein [Aureimonas pseudogalii]|uniref:Uncharacterized protein n=1 Tax=Aureimonas pseudogalii TaxID=1744844 RepID=A0A7W6EGW2_9HYPH|nr:hypothetical protein [Aureimonas pseudogalii]MBB3998143.1 hypothetical protein [Aureimonas pseudogalii]
MANGWLAPALLAAIVAALVSVVGWFATARQSVWLEQRRRLERMRDFQIALRAEIRAELVDLEAYDLEEAYAAIRDRYANEPGFSVRVSAPPRHPIFEAIVDEIHVLPEEVIDPVVLYARQRWEMEGVANDIRDPSFNALSAERQLDVVGDYVNARRRLTTLAQTAVAALGQLPR